MNSTSDKQALLLVSGHVQGVFFRAHAQEEAEKLSLTGYARNLADGKVEILLQGPHEKILTFIEWAKEGSPSSKVTDVTVSWENIDTPRNKFETF